MTTVITPHAEEDDVDEDSMTPKQLENHKMMESIQGMLDNETLAYLSYLSGNMREAFDFYFAIMQNSWIKGNRYKIFHWFNEVLSNPETTIA